MIYLAFIFHMHQPYYKNLLTQETELPWVRLHGTKDYLDMVKILEKYPAIHQTFNLVPSLLEQIEDYTNHTIKDKYLEFSYKPAAELTREDKEFILNNFFSINTEKVIACHPRYYELYFKKKAKKEFTTQDYLDLQVWFNLAWIDPIFRQAYPELKCLVNQARFFSEEEKENVLNRQIEILKNIIPAYKEMASLGQIEVSISPYYHPILPLLYNTSIAKEANLKSALPKINFAYPEDARSQIDSALDFFRQRIGNAPLGMWPSEESVSEHILPFLIQAKINWIVADEGILFKSLKLKRRDAKLIYQPHLLKRKDGDLNIIFRDRNLSDLIGFVYHAWKAETAVDDFMKHLGDINDTSKGKDVLVTVAMDGENAWEYYTNDGHDFLDTLYARLSDSKFIKCVSVSEYLKRFAPKLQIKRLAAGSWIYADFGKWMGNPYKVKAWEWLAAARKELEQENTRTQEQANESAWKQIYILEGSDWFWWYGEDPDGSFDRLFRMHLANFYQLIGREAPDYLKKPLKP